MAIKEGWTGRIYEDFEVGDICKHPLGRTVLAADNVWFTLITQNTNPIHFDQHYAAKTEFKRILVNVRDGQLDGDLVDRESAMRFVKDHPIGERRT